MKRKELIRAIESFCPSAAAEAWDNCGFQVNCGKEEIACVLVSLEVTNEIIDEAIAEGADFILTHHPLLFQGVKKIDDNDVIGNYLIRLIQNQISVYACHTNFDKLPGGNNDYIGKLLELSNVRPFDDDNGFCRKGNTPFETTFIEVVHKAAECFDIDEKYFKCVGDPTTAIDTIGWCSGAGSEFIRAAAEEGCDLYITGDLKYHEAQLAKEMGICILDAGHYGSEKIFAENMADFLRVACEDDDIEILESMTDINPFL